MKKLLLIVFFVFVLSLFGISSSALGMTSNGVIVDYVYEDEERTVPWLDQEGKQYLTVVGYSGSSGNVKIPQTVKMNEESGELTVIAVDEAAFAENKYISSVVIPDSVVRIGKSAFSGCTNLISVTLPSGITKIDDDTFYGCTVLLKVNLPQGLSEIGISAFEKCTMLSRLKIPFGVVSIGKNAFMTCENLVLDCSENDYALAYAEENNICTSVWDSASYKFWMIVVLSLVVGFAVIIVYRKVIKKY